MQVKRPTYEHYFLDIKEFERFFSALVKTHPLFLYIYSTQALRLACFVMFYSTEYIFTYPD